MAFIIYILWLLVASLLGLLISGIFAGKLKYSREKFLFPYIGLISIFIGIYVYWSNLDFLSLISQNWIWGVIAGLIAGGFLVKNVMSQPSSESKEDSDLTMEILWFGIAYGIIDALFLNILPVIIIWEAFTSLGIITPGFGLFLVLLLALLGSILVTVLYHIGYPEFRNKRLLFVIIGNTIITITFLISFNPIGPLLSHTMMHVAAVLKGPETTIQLPPHY